MSNTADVLMVDGQFIGYLPPMNSFELLWENQSPTSSFAAQTVTLASDDYDFLLFIHRVNNGSTSPCNSLCIPKGQGGNFCVGGTSSNGVIGNDRRITYTDDTHIAYGDNNYCYGTNATSVSNTRNIPYKIYGFKVQGNPIGGSGSAWKYLTTTTGQVDIPLPSKFNELICYVRAKTSSSDTASRIYTFNIVKNLLTSTVQYPRAGSYNDASNFVSVTVGASTSIVRMHAVIVNGIDNGSIL